ncbi:hypothetical protein [Antarctobacter heliothermus]|uniref:Lipoprotein n=1 Tax=Antarctobacter heliothermus TaxID=74033 RepID=A0A239FQM1_9RHOB|nr:hypothetical protein [Antarctobacter heliothermus]SNS58938.1 hypothetical protein SAMN04488078_102157 [Antarctobacter heliothermus]
MFKSVSVLLFATLVLTSCGAVRDSRVNPLNWFGRSQSAPVVVTDAEVNPLIPRRKESVFRQEKDTSYRGTTLGEITELVIERRPGGAIIRATAVADQLEAFDLKLVEVEEESGAGTLTYAFRGLQPRRTQGPVASRTHTAAVWVTDNQLRDVRVIQVKGARNVRTVKR